MENQMDIQLKLEMGDDVGLFPHEERYMNVVTHKFCEGGGEPRRREKIVGDSVEKTLREVGGKGRHAA